MINAMFMRRLFIIGLFVLCFPCMNAWATIHELDYLSTRNGLSDNTINSIFQDSFGFMWISTRNGLCRYDGHEVVKIEDLIQTYPHIKNRNISAALEQPAGFLWIQHANFEAVCYDMLGARMVDFTGKGDAILQCTTLAADNGVVWAFDSTSGTLRSFFNAENGLFDSHTYKLDGNPTVSFVSPYNGGAWIGTPAGLYHVKNGTADFFLEGENLISARVLPDYGIFFLTSSGKIYRFNNNINKLEFQDSIFEQNPLSISGQNEAFGKWYLSSKEGNYVFDAASGKALTISSIPLKDTQIIKDNTGNLWFTNYGKQLFWIKKDTNNQPVVLELSVPFNDKVNYDLSLRFNVAALEDGSIALSYYGYGLFIYNPLSDSFSHYGPFSADPTVIKSNFIRVLAEDHSGGLWIGYEQGGVSLFKVYESLAQFIMPRPLDQSEKSNAVRMVKARENGTVFLSTRDNAVYDYDLTTSRFLSQTNLSYNVYSTLLDSKGRQWMGTRSEGLIIDGNFYRSGSSAFSIRSDAIFDILEDRDGRIWIATFGGGVCQAQETPAGFRFITFMDSNNREKAVRVLREDKNGVIWSAGDDGLYAFEPDKLFVDRNAFLHFDMASGTLPGDEVKSIFIDDQGRLWVGITGEGLLVGKVPDNYEQYPNIEFKHFTVSDGLSNNNVVSFLQDGYGNIWIGTEAGLNIYDDNSGNIQSVDISPYMQRNILEENSCCRVGDKLLFGTKFGAALIDASRFMPSTKEVDKPVISRLFVNGEPYTKLFPHQDNIKLSFQQTSLDFQISDFAYSEMSHTTYMWYLEGKESEWKPASRNSIASYRNLRPGKYIFHYRTTGENQIGITICPAPWFSVWAFICYAIILAVLGYEIKNILYILRLHKYAQTATSPDTEASKRKSISDAIYSIAKENIHDADFNMDVFAEKMGMKRTEFFRIVKENTGLTPGEVIRQQRMNTAAELLEEDKERISDIAFMVGIDNPIYFSKLFKDEFGVTPSEYRKRRRRE